MKTDKNVCKGCLRGGCDLRCETVTKCDFRISGNNQVSSVANNSTAVNDNVHHPKHYIKGGIECIDVIRAVLGKYFKYYCIGNVIKYVFRAFDKNGNEDLRKAKVYLDWAIEEDKP